MVQLAGLWPSFFISELGTITDFPKMETESHTFLCGSEKLTDFTALPRWRPCVAAHSGHAQSVPTTQSRSPCGQEQKAHVGRCRRFRFTLGSAEMLGGLRGSRLQGPEKPRGAQRHPAPLAPWLTLRTGPWTSEPRGKAQWRHPHAILGLRDSTVAASGGWRQRHALRCVSDPGRDSPVSK